MILIIVFFFCSSGCSFKMFLQCSIFANQQHFSLLCHCLGGDWWLPELWKSSGCFVWGIQVHLQSKRFFLRQTRSETGGPAAQDHPHQEVCPCSPVKSTNHAVVLTSFWMSPVSGPGRESKSLPPTFSRRLYAEDAREAVRLCEALLDEPELDPAVRIGDAYGFVVEHHCQQGNFQVVNTDVHNCWNKTFAK